LLDRSPNNPDSGAANEQSNQAQKAQIGRLRGGFLLGVYFLLAALVLAGGFGRFLYALSDKAARLSAEANALYALLGSGGIAIGAGLCLFAMSQVR
jgi:hypothetical protein